MPTSIRSTTIVRLVVLAVLLLGLAQGIGAGSAVRADDATPDATSAPSDVEYVDPTAVPTEVPTDIPTESAVEQPPTQTPTVSPTTLPPISTPETATVVPTGSATESQANGAEFGAANGKTGVLITAMDLSNGNAPVAGVCATLLETVLGVWQDSGCTDANGHLELNPAFRLREATLFDIEIIRPAGYIGLDFIDLTLAEGVFREETLGLELQPPANDTMRALDIGSNTVLGGVCWSYFSATTIFGELGDLAVGPVCDTDNDGVTSIPQVPFGAYCIVPTPPTGYRVTGTSSFCVDATGSRDRTRAFIANAAGSGTAVVTVTTAWGTPLSGVCLDATLQSILISDTLVSTGCSGEDGIATITGLVSGDYELTASIGPSTTLEPDPIDFTIVDATPVRLALTIETKSSTVKLDALVGFGPEMLPGACWAVTTNDGGSPGSITIVAPVCDDDGDGEVLMAGVPYTASCIVVTPPAGWYRPLRDYSLCDEFFGGYWRAGFIPEPKPATPSPTPRPTSTPFPTPVPAENEPNGNLAVQNCAYTGFDFNFRIFDLCKPVGAGVRLAVIQNGVQIATIVTNAAGQAVLDLPARSQYQLTYLDGNESGWIPGSGQEARIRYGSSDNFSFTPNTGNPTWTMTVRTGSMSPWNSGAGIGGACYRILDEDGAELLPTVCDTDNDGEVVVGTLPSTIKFLHTIPYRAEMVTAPPGYKLWGSVSPGLASADDPETWLATFNYFPLEVRIHTVDENGDPLPGWCYVHQDSFSNCDDDGDGIVVFDRMQPGDLMVFTAEAYSEGYFPNTPSQSITIGSEPSQDLTFTAYRYGTDRDDRADARFTLRSSQGTVLWESDDVCFSISPNSGVPSGTLCADQNGVFIYRNLPAGSYTLKLVSNAFAGCETPESFPQQAFTVTNDDLGTVIEIPVVFRCPDVSAGTTCSTVRSPVTRNVDIYLGTLTDPESGDVLVDGMEFSEAISYLAADELMRWADNPVPDKINATTIQEWVLESNEGSVWGMEPDWDGNARGALLGQFAAAGPFVAGEPELLGEALVIGSVGFDIYFVNGPNDPTLALFPECESTTDTIDASVFHQASIKIYKVDATLAPEQNEPTPTATPEPVCSMSATRTITAAYGELTDAEGNPVFTGLELSDHIPQGLLDAINAGAAPDAIRDLIADWLDPATTDATWAFEAAEGRDPNAALSERYDDAGLNVMIGAPVEAGSEEYRFTSYAWVGQNELPAGCFVAASMDLLVPVALETVVQVDYVELNAAVGGSGTVVPQPSPTVTPTPSAEPETSPTPVVSPTLTPVTVSSLPLTGAPSGGQTGSAPWLLLLIAALVLAAIWVKQRFGLR